MSNLKVSKNGASFVLSGVLDESADLTAFKGASGAITVNFKNVERINSCGVREWVVAFSALAQAQPTFEECSLVVVKQLNAVPDFKGKASVKNFYAPYFCEACDKEDVQLFQSSEVKPDQAAPERTCGTCKKPMSFDAIPSQYFSFLK